MGNAIKSFFEAWGMEDAKARAAAISAAFTASGTYADPRSDGALSGAAIAAYVDMFSANAPGWTASVVKADTVAGMVRATVAFAGAGPDGDMVQHGQYFAQMDGDLIASMTGFAGTGAPE